MARFYLNTSPCNFIHNVLLYSRPTPSPWLLDSSDLSVWGVVESERWLWDGAWSDLLAVVTQLKLVIPIIISSTTHRPAWAEGFCQLQLSLEYLYTGWGGEWEPPETPITVEAIVTDVYISHHYRQIQMEWLHSPLSQTWSMCSTAHCSSTSYFQKNYSAMRQSIFLI